MHTTDAAASQRVDQIRFIGQGLQRPECVLCTRAGHWYSADVRGGVIHGLPDGSQRLYRADLGAGRKLRPNGIALRPDGSFLLADLGDELGGVFELRRDNTIRPFVERVDGIDLPPSNFVVQDHKTRVWITVSTRLMPRALGYNAKCSDGFIVLVDDAGARIVADGLGYTNECVLNAAGDYLYVNETFGRRLSRFSLAADGSLGAREIVAEFGEGVYPDGLAFDQAGDLWVTSIVSNRLLRVAPDGSQTVWLEDADDAHLANAEAAYHAGTMGREHLDAVQSRRLKNISSLAFGGPDLKTGYFGCLLGEQIGTIAMPVAGLAPAHWRYDD